MMPCPPGGSMGWLDVLKKILDLLKALVELVRWIAAGGPLRITLALLAAIILGVIISVLAISEDRRRELWGDLWPWFVALQSGREVLLSENQVRVVDSRIAYLKTKVKSELDDHFNPVKLRQLTGRYTSWTASQGALALASDFDAGVGIAKVGGFFPSPSRELPPCGFLNEFTTDQAPPQNLLLSALIFFQPA